MNDGTLTQKTRSFEINHQNKLSDPSFLFDEIGSFSVELDSSNDFTNIRRSPLNLTTLDMLLGPITNNPSPLEEQRIDLLRSSVIQHKLGVFSFIG